MAYNGTLVGSPAFATGKFGNALSNTDQNNYIALPAGALSSAASYTIEAWVNTTNYGYFFGSNGNAGDNVWLGIVDNKFTVSANLPGTGNSGADYPQGPSIVDGAWHHVAATFSATQIQMFVDGVLVYTLATTGSVTLTTLAGSLGKFGGLPMIGLLDEFAIWDGVRYTGNFTPPTAPYTGTETGLHSLYHLESDGTDSKQTVVPGMVNINDPGIIWSPYNWSVASGAARTINSGAYFRTIFTGTSVGLAFQTTGNGTPYSQLVARIDKGAWIPVTLAAGNPTISIATALDNHPHELEVVVKSTSELLIRWPAAGQTTGLSMITITAIQLDNGATLSAPRRRTKNALIFGDSITEGVRTVNSTATNDTDRNDVRSDYSYDTLSRLDCEFGVVGFGATGIVIGGSGGVPPLFQAYATVFPGVARDFATYPPDVVVYNEGTNDNGYVQGGGSIPFGSSFASVIQGILAVAPRSQHLCMEPFGGYLGPQIQQMVAGLADARVSYIDTTGWFNTANSSDALHPYGFEHLANLGPRLLPLIEAKLYPQGRSYSFS